MGYVPPPPPYPPPRVVDAPGPLLGYCLIKPIKAIKAMCGLGYGDQIAELFPQEVPMVITDAPGRPKGPSCYKCAYCGCIHREADLSSTANCPNCGGNNLIRLDPDPPSLEQSLEAQRHAEDHSRLDQLLGDPGGVRKVALALGPTMTHCRNYTESGGPK